MITNMSEEIIGAGEGNRTLVISLEGWSFTTKLHPRSIYKFIYNRLTLVKHLMARIMGIPHRVHMYQHLGLRIVRQNFMV